MKRRFFVKQLGKGITSSVVLPGMVNTHASRKRLTYQYPEITSIGDLMNDEGLIAVRVLLEGKAENSDQRLRGSVQIKSGKINRIRTYFNLGDNYIDEVSRAFDLSSLSKESHILTCWLNKVSETTELVCRMDKEDLEFPLKELISMDEMICENDQLKITVNCLPYFEIGTINPEKLGISYGIDQFRFVIMADPQGGDPDDKTNESPTRIKIHNAFIEESIEVANELDPSSLFTIVLGDFTDSKGQESNFNRMINYYEKLKNPILLEIGNHETSYGAIFTPGYFMSEFNNYFAAQKKINGLEKLLYAFDIGQWHFIIWPDPLRNNFWETHPHYFDWLERDLEKNKHKSTFFFQHVPIHPIGINPLVSYVNPVHINRLLFNILSRYGNVKYVFSGHVHIPIKASNKTALSYLGMNMINLPPTGYRPRAFGEQDLYGGPSQGICIVDVETEKANISFRTVSKETFNYPGNFRNYSPEEDPLWFKYKWELDGNNEILNGDFENELDHWYQQYIYAEDHDPSNKKDVLRTPGRTGHSLYLFSRKRGYDVPGQDRLPQSLNQLTQVINAPPERIPSIQFGFRIDGTHYFPDSWNGAFLWIEGYSGKHLNLSLVYVIGRGTYSIGGSYGRAVKSIYFDITDEPDQWHEAIINVGHDYLRSNGNQSILSLNIDKYAINFGAWTVNDGHQQEIGVYIDDVILEFNYKDHTGESRLDDKPIILMDEQKIFTSRIRHEAGEHQYASQLELYPF